MNRLQAMKAQKVLSAGKIKISGSRKLPGGGLAASRLTGLATPLRLLLFKVLGGLRTGLIEFTGENIGRYVIF
jgi:hypothetical protein